MRTGGTTQLSSREIDRQFDLIAASATIAMAMESAHVGFSVLAALLDKGLDLLSQILIHPVFEPGKVELARQLQLEEIRRIKDDPQKLAMREFSRLIYHQDPRGRFPSGASLTDIKRDDLMAFHSRFFLPNNIMFAVSGDITKEKAVEKIKQYFGGWNTKTTVQRIFRAAATTANRYVFYRKGYSPVDDYQRPIRHRKKPHPIFMPSRPGFHRRQAADFLPGS